MVAVAVAVPADIVVMVARVEVILHMELLLQAGMAVLEAVQ